VSWESLIRATCPKNQIAGVENAGVGMKDVARMRNGLKLFLHPTGDKKVG